MYGKENTAEYTVQQRIMNDARETWKNIEEQENHVRRLIHEGSLDAVLKPDGAPPVLSSSVLKNIRAVKIEIGELKQNFIDRVDKEASKLAWEDRQAIKQSAYTTINLSPERIADVLKKDEKAKQADISKFAAPAIKEEQPERTSKFIQSLNFTRRKETKEMEKEDKGILSSKFARPAKEDK